MAILSSTVIRTALIDYRAELIRMQIKYPGNFNNAEHSKLIKSIDDVLYEIEGNITSVTISANTCKTNP